LAFLVLVGWPLAALAARSTTAPAIEMHAHIAEDGGWTPGELNATMGEPLRLRLTSDDVMHGFAVGQSDQPPVDVKPGEMTTAEFTFDAPGRYVFYCTRWCGPNHWRMTGSILVAPPPGATPAPPQTAEPPLYMRLGLDIDAPHPADVVPAARPSAARGAALASPKGALDVSLPERYRSVDYYRATSPAQAWRDLRADAVTHGLDDQEVWDLVAWLWQSNATDADRADGRDIYAANCAACHGAGGAGDGVFAVTPEPPGHAAGTGLKPPGNFTDPLQMLGASPALLYGKMLRGGMGTGMPSWGPIFTERQLWAALAYVWGFQFDLDPIDRRP
jgi:mono/diheme cytochrome c family protein/plastocyanin